MPVLLTQIDSSKDDEPDLIKRLLNQITASQGPPLAAQIPLIKVPEIEYLTINVPKIKKHDIKKITATIKKFRGLMRTYKD